MNNTAVCFVLKTVVSQNPNDRWRCALFRTVAAAVDAVFAESHRQHVSAALSTTPALENAAGRGKIDYLFSGSLCAQAVAANTAW